MDKILHIFTTADGWVSLISLTFMEIVLGIDNIVFISIITNRVALAKQRSARNIGIALALVMRIILLSFISYLASAESTLFSLLGNDFSMRDIIMLAGGLFLLYKSTTEIHHKFNIDEEIETEKKTRVSFTQVIIQIIMVDIVFSFDSIITAIGLANDLSIMIMAVVISMIIMLLVTKSISQFIEKHPSVKMLALSFLLMIGVLLVIEAFDVHVSKGYVYFAMAFSLLVEMLNIRLHIKKSNRKS